MLAKPVQAGRWVDPAPSLPESKLRLFCIPYAGGSAVVFRDWHSRVPATVDLRPVHLPGRGIRFQETPLRRLDAIAEALAEAVLPLTNRPWAVFGHSMGALVAFELVHRLRVLGAAAPQCLFVSGRGAPDRPARRRPMHQLPDAEFVDAVMRLNGTPAEVLASTELLELMTPMLRADFEAVETYRAPSRPPLDCRVVALGGKDDPDVTRDDVAAWQGHTTGAFRAEILPGDHFFVNRLDPLFAIIGEELRALSAS